MIEQSYFIATLLLETRIKQINYHSYTEEIILIKSENQELATNAAIAYGRDLETNYLNKEQQEVEIVFCKLNAIQSTLQDGFNKKDIWELRSKTFYDIDAYNKVDE
jgi:Domain of unknown function (DUF4288)